MTDQEIQTRRSVEFQTALENLIARYGFDLTAPYSHNVDGLQIAGNAQVRLQPRAGWQPPADWTPPASGNGADGEKAARTEDSSNGNETAKGKKEK